MTYPHDNPSLLEAKDRYDAIDIALYEFLQKVQEDLSGPFDHREDDVALEAFSDQWARILHNELTVEHKDDLLFLAVHLYRGEIALERRWMGMTGHTSEVLRHRFKLLRTTPLTPECESVKALADLLCLLYPQLVIARYEEDDAPSATDPRDAAPAHRVVPVTLTSADLERNALIVLGRLTGEPTLDRTPAFGQLLFSGQGFRAQLLHLNHPTLAQSGLIRSPHMF